MAKTETIRHSLSHILALAVKELYPKVKFGIGPAIENGFYYDFDFSKVSELQQKKIQQDKKQRSKKEPEKVGLSLKDLPKIEKRMKELIKKDLKFEKKIVSKSEAKKIFKDQPYKLELIDEIEEKNVSLYKSGEFLDLCRGPHVKSSGEIPADGFKLTRVAGSYWKGNENKPMLTRIYGVSFQTKKELDMYLEAQKEAEKRDHRVLGKKLEIFMLDEEVGQGLPLWLPKGATLRRLIENYLYQELKGAGYQWVVTPHIGRLKLWKTSGHWELYRENMYSPIEIDEEKYLIKPMNCPFHVKIYQSKIRSYKDLPVKYAELGTVYRYERSGTLHGLTRVRGFTQDDAHIWSTPEQLNDELTKLLKHGLKMLRDFGFKDFVIYLSTRPAKFAGTEKGWEKATNSLKYVLKKLKLDYQIDPGGGVFYGPKIDIKIKDSLGREWQCTTIQVDFNLPEKFNITYIDKRGKKVQPIMIHRALLGSLERFIGVLLEHYMGSLPLWLAPIQCLVIPVGKSHRKYAEDIAEKLKNQGLRAEARTEAETVSKKIREGEIQKIPYLLVVGDKEIKKKTIRVRQREKGDIGETKLTNFLKKIKLEIENKK